MMRVSQFLLTKYNCTLNVILKTFLDLRNRWYDVYHKNTMRVCNLFSGAL